jgi:hypothetical protein
MSIWISRLIVLRAYKEFTAGRIEKSRHSGLDPESSIFLGVALLDAGSESGMTGNLAENSLQAYSFIELDNCR